MKSSTGTPANRICTRIRHGWSWITTTSRSLVGPASPRTMLPAITIPGGAYAARTCATTSVAA